MLRVYLWSPRVKGSVGALNGRTCLSCVSLHSCTIEQSRDVMLNVVRTRRMIHALAELFVHTVKIFDLPIMAVKAETLRGFTIFPRNTGTVLLL